MYYQYLFVNQYLIEHINDRFVLIVEDVEIEHEKPIKKNKKFTKREMFFFN